MPETVAQARNPRKIFLAKLMVISNQFNCKIIRLFANPMQGLNLGNVEGIAPEQLP